MITERPYALEHVVRGISFLGCGVCFIANVCSAIPVVLLLLIGRLVRVAFSREE